MINKKIKIKKIQKEYLLNSLFKSKNFYGESLKETKKKIYLLFMVFDIIIQLLI